MSYYCKGEICQRSKECLRAESWRTFRGKENTEGLWFVHEPTCVRSDYEDGVFRSRDEGDYERFIEIQATLARMLKNNYFMKTYYLTLSRVFPTTHARAGEPTMFEQNAFRWPSVLDKPGTFYKIHTMRANYEFWRKRFEKIASGEAVLSIRVWVGKPYAKGSAQREIIRLTREDGIGIQKLEFKNIGNGFNAAVIDGKPWPRQILANNDGLSLQDWREWFKGYDLTKPMAIIHFTSYRYL